MCCHSTASDTGKWSPAVCLGGKGTGSFPPTSLVSLATCRTCAFLDITGWARSYNRWAGFMLEAPWAGLGWVLTLQEGAESLFSNFFGILEIVVLPASSTVERLLGWGLCLGFTLLQRLEAIGINCRTLSGNCHPICQKLKKNVCCRVQGPYCQW